MLKRVLAVAAALVVGACAFAQSVNGSWGNWASVPSGKIGGDYFSYKKQVEIKPNGSAVGAKFCLENGEVKFKKESYVALYHNNKPAGSIEKTLTNKQWRKAEYSIAIDAPATITITVAGNGSKEEGRVAVLASKEVAADGNATYTKLAGLDNLSQDEAPKSFSYSAPAAGTYYLLVNGSRIVAVEAKN